MPAATSAGLTDLVPIVQAGVNKSVTPALLAQVQRGITADVDGGTITFDASLNDKHAVTLGGNRTLAITGDYVGQVVTFLLKQDGTGSRSVTWFSGILWPAGTAPTLTTTANKTDVFSVIKLGTGSYLGFIVGQNL
jgi:hypothetical protein